MTELLSIIESSMHPDFSQLYRSVGIMENRTNSIRKAISHLKKTQPDFIVCEFFYGYGNNYAGVNISNLDVLLSTLQKYSSKTNVIIIVDKSERQYVDKLNDLYPIHQVLVAPVQEADMKIAITN